MLCEFRAQQQPAHRSQESAQSTEDRGLVGAGPLHARLKIKEKPVCNPLGRLESSYSAHRKCLVNTNAVWRRARLLTCSA